MQAQSHCPAHPLVHMANRVRETQEKRRREQAKQARQASKEAERRERDAKKKADKLAGVVRPTPVFQTAAEMTGDLDRQLTERPLVGKEPQ